MRSSGSRFRALVVATGGVAVLAGCGPSHDASSHASKHAASHVPSHPASPSGPAETSAAVAAEDGTDLHACADGKCEVRVGPAARIPVPHRLGVTSVRVLSVSATKVTIVGTYAGNSSSSSGSGNFSADSSNGRYRLTIGVGSEVVQNGMDVAVVALQGGFAVLRISPA